MAQRPYSANNNYLTLDKRKIIGYSRVSILDPSRPPEGSEDWLAAMKQHLQRPKGWRRSEFREQSENVYENKGFGKKVWGLRQTLLLNVCDAPKAQFGQIVPLALACPFGTSQTPTSRSAPA